MKSIVRIVMTTLALSGAALCATPPTRPPAAGAVRMEVQNSQFHVLDNVMLTVTRLDAWMIPKSQVIDLDKMNSFILQIVSGETRMKAPDLSALMNEYLFPHAREPIKNMTVTFENGTVVVKGDLHKAIDVPFEGKGALSIADNSDIRLRFTELKVAGIIKKGFLDALGIKLSSIAQPGKQWRFHIEGNDIILPIAALFPPPRVAGTLTSVRIDGDDMVQVFGPPDATLKDPPVPAKNYIYFHGGRIIFGKLTMNDVDLELIDKDPSNPLDFSIVHYYAQLQAGSFKMTANQGLVAYVADYSAIAPKPQPAP